MRIISMLIEPGKYREVGRYLGTTVLTLKVEANHAEYSLVEIWDNDLLKRRGWEGASEDMLARVKR